MRKSGIFFNAFIILGVLIFFRINTAYSGLPNFHFPNSYFFPANKKHFAVNIGNIGIPNAYINYIEASFDYGVNDNVKVGVSVPLLFMMGVQDSAMLGDISFYFKGSIYKSGLLTWRIIADLYFKLGTGVVKEESLRKIDGVSVYYYPFFTGTSLFSPTAIFSLLIKDLLINAGISYRVENKIGDAMFDFVSKPIRNLMYPSTNANSTNTITLEPYINYDRIDFQLSFDYYFKFAFKRDFEKYFIIRPVISFEYKLNLSQLEVIPDGLFLYLEFNLKFYSDIKFKILLTMPIYTKTPIYYYNISMEIGKSF